MAGLWQTKTAKSQVEVINWRTVELHEVARRNSERDLNDVFQQAVQLPERDRATLAGLLIETLDPVSEPDVEAAWFEEIERRLAEIDAGAVELIPWEEVRAELFGESE